MAVKSADRKPEKYIGPDGKVRIRMVPVDKEVVKSEKAFKEMRSKYSKREPMKKVKPMGEAKDPEEYDKEGDMAKTQLKTMIDAAQELHDQLSDDENMPEWVQNKITKATDYIDSVRDYMKNNDDVNEETTEAVEIEELTAAEKKLVNQMYDKKGNLTPLGKKVMNHGKKPGDRGYTESLDEVLDRPGALDSYRKKAKMKSDKARNTATAKLVRGNPDISKEKETIRKREKGQDMADRVGVKQFRKSIGRGYTGKKEETVDEISNAKMGQYVRKAADDAARQASKGDAKGIVKARQRVKGVSKAMDKMDTNRLFGKQ